jgi:hypothetical protein
VRQKNYVFLGGVRREGGGGGENENMIEIMGELKN